MEGTYPVMSGSISRGTANIQRQGLYYLIHCCCDPVGEPPFRLYIAWDDRQRELGLCANNGKFFGIVCRIPVKEAGQGIPRFSVRADSLSPQEEFYPVESDKPFSHLALIRHSVLGIRGGIVGIVVKGRSQDPQGNDQNP